MKRSTTPPSPTSITRLVFRWASLSLVACSLGWILLTGAAFGYVKFRRHISTAEYLDFLLPQRWPQYQIKRGEHLIRVGLSRMANGKFNEGYYQLRAGLIRAPGNLRGRLALAQILEFSRRADLAQSTLLAGMAYHSRDPEYVVAVMTFLSARAEDQLVVDLSKQLLESPTSGQQVREIAAINAANARYSRGDYDQAEEFLVKNNVNNTLNGRLLLAQCEWERGYHELALLALRNLNREFPTADSVYAVLSTYLRSNGHNSEAHQLAVLHQIAVPENSRSRVDQLKLLLSEGNTIALESASREAFENFKDDPAGMLALGDFAASNGRVNLARDILNHFIGQQWENETAVRLIYIEALLVAQKYQDAQPEIQALLSQPELSAVYVNIANGFLAIAHYGLGDAISGYASLSTMIAQPNLRADSLLAMANRLLAMDQQTPARELLNHAVKIDPRNQAALTRLVEMDVNSKNVTALSVTLPKLLRMRRPSPRVLTQAQILLRSDAYLFLSHRRNLLDNLGATLSGTNQVLANN